MRAEPDQLRWVIDDVIPHTAALRALMGDVTILPGRDITPDTICDADILLVRSITAVNESLLAGSSVQFVGTAGLELDARSEINANPKDTKDHPRGVWTLPPTLAAGDTDRERYVAIGESDRMTLRFVKPAE